MACCLSKRWDSCAGFHVRFDAVGIVIVFSVKEHLNLKLGILCVDYRVCGAPVVL